MSEKQQWKTSLENLGLKVSLKREPLWEKVRYERREIKYWARPPSRVENNTAVFFQQDDIINNIDNIYNKMYSCEVLFLQRGQSIFLYCLTLTFHNLIWWIAAGTEMRKLRHGECKQNESTCGRVRPHMRTRDSKPRVLPTNASPRLMTVMKCSVDQWDQKIGTWLGAVRPRLADELRSLRGVPKGRPLTNTSTS